MSFFQRIIAWFKSLFASKVRSIPTNPASAARMAAREAGVPTNMRQAAGQAGLPTNAAQAAHQAGMPGGMVRGAQMAQGAHQANQAQQQLDQARQQAHNAQQQQAWNAQHPAGGQGNDQGWQIGESDGTEDGAATVALTNLPPELLAAYDQRMGAPASPNEANEATMALSDLTPEMLAQGSPAHEEWQELQAFKAEAERRNLNLCGINPHNPEEWWQRQFAIDQAQADGRPREQAVREQGFENETHWERVSQYVNAVWSELRRDEDGDWAVLHKDEFTNAAMRARQGNWQQQTAQNEADNPQLFEPIHGVSLETYAAATVLAGSMQGGDLDGALRERFGIDKATYDAAAAGWQERMSQDMTYALVTRYGQLFGQAQTGNPNAGQAPGVAGAGGHGDAPPVTFEQYCEVMAAQAVWAENGLDVNAMLTREFGITAMDYSGWSQYWSPRMGTDIALVNRYSELDAYYRQQHQAKLGSASPASRDDDLSF